VQAKALQTTVSFVGVLLKTETLFKFVRWFTNIGQNSSNCFRSDCQLKLEWLKRREATELNLDTNLGNTQNSLWTVSDLLHGM